MNTHALALFSLVSLATLAEGCCSGGCPAPSTATIDLPEGWSIGWGLSYQAQDDTLGLLIGADAMVIDTVDGYPLERIGVEVESGYGGVYIVPPKAVQQRDYPQVPGCTVGDEDFDQCVEDAIAEECEGDDGKYSADSPEWCAWWYDVETGQFYEVSGNAYSDASDYTPDGEGGFHPSVMEGETDDRGLLRFYFYVDVMPGTQDAESGEVTWGDVAIWATIGVASDEMIISVAE